MIEVLSSRRYGEPKLKKPAELKGVKPIGSAGFGPKCKCPVLVKNETVYVKHRDWFSQGISIRTALEYGIVKKKKNKFVYNDNFGSVVLRNEAWIRIQVPDWQAFSPHLVDQLISDTEAALGLEEFSLYGYDWTKFYEDIVQLMNK